MEEVAVGLVGAKVAGPEAALRKAQDLSTAVGERGGVGVDEVLQGRLVELQEEVRSRKGEARSERSGAPTL